ncbi:MAG: hypothetical protein KF866_13035, partial [Phycisphaeraceae bacterium]|nr:hypothetical protein [Phycisphaeraceae bacterium]
GGNLNILVKHDVNEWVKKNVYEKVEELHNRTVFKDVVEEYQENQYTFVAQLRQLNAQKVVVEGQDLISHKSKKILIEGSSDGVSIKSGADMKLTANGVLALKGGSKIAGEGQMGVSFKGLQVILEGQTGVTLKVGGSFVSITPAGVDIVGPLVKLNSGGAAGGSADSPAAADAATAAESADIMDPAEAAVADDGKPGKVSRPGSGRPVQRTPRTIDPQRAPDSPPFPPPPAPAAPAAPAAPPVAPPAETDEEWEIEQLIEVFDGAASAQQAANGRRQYINFDRTAAGQWDHGRTIFLRAKLKWKTGDQSRSLAGKKVYWKATPDGANKTGLVAALKHGFGGTADKVDDESSVDAQGWTPVVQFRLSKYGGDKFKVAAASDSAFADKRESGEWEIWRKLFYELDGMVRPGGGSYSSRHDDARLRNTYSGQFVELVSTGSDSAPAFQRVVTETEANAWARNCRDGTGSPRYFHLVYIDTIAWDPAVDPVVRTINPGSGVSFDPSSWTLDPRDYLVGCEYRQPAGSGAWTALPNARVALSETGSIATRDDRQVVTPDLTGLVDPGQQVEVRLQIRHYDEGSGLQSGPATLVGMRWRERAYAGAELANRTMRTSIHEPGHSMGQASRTRPDGSNNPNYYVNGGGHCNNLSNGCVMYHSNSPNTAFCPICSDSLKARDLSSLPVSGTAAYT